MMFDDELILRYPEDVSPFKDSGWQGNTWESKYPFHQWYRRMLAARGMTLRDAATEYTGNYQSLLRVLDRPYERMRSRTRKRLAEILDMEPGRMMYEFKRWLKGEEDMGDLSEHFNKQEFACHHCGEVKVDMRLVDKLEALRHELGNVPVVIVSGYRCPVHNRAVGGAPHSFHVRGMAADIRVPGVPLYRVAIAAVKVGFSGVGYYPHPQHRFVHVDIGIGMKRPQWWVKRHPEGEYEYVFSPRV